MFKLVALCCFLAAASASPGALIAPLTYSSHVLAPASAYVSRYPSSLAYSSPLISSAPFSYSGSWNYPHFIKKRSLAVSSYIAPSSYFAPSSYITPSSYIAPAYTYPGAAPLVSSYSAVAPLGSYSAPVYTAAAHLIKKRSVFLPNTYVAPSVYAGLSPFIASTYAAGSSIAPVWSSSLYPAAQYAHFIKKRSAPLAYTATYAAPSTVSHTSRFDFEAVSPAYTYTSFAGTSPNVYGAQTYSHVI